MPKYVKAGLYFKYSRQTTVVFRQWSKLEHNTESFLYIFIYLFI